MSIPPPAEEFLSAAFDAELSDEDNARPGGVDAQHARQLTDAWQQLGDCLRQLPESGPTDVSEAVLFQIRRDQQRPIVRPDRSPNSDWFARRVAVVASTVAVLLVSFSVMSLMTGLPDGDRFAAVVDSRPALVVPQEWEVVVLTVPDNGLHEIPDAVRQTVSDQGLHIHSLAELKDVGEDHPDLLVASGDLKEAFQELFDSHIDGIDAEWNPERVGEVDREMLLQRFAESMETPTRSEEFFGRMFVVLPGDNTLVQRPVAGVSNDTALVADHSSAGNRGPAEATGAAQPDESVSDHGSPAQIAAYLNKGKGKPVLVVLLRRRLPDSNTQGHFAPFSPLPGV
ncbi:MAG: hypothetical protein RIK87_17945 [Fuerstiella sp.]